MPSSTSAEPRWWHGSEKGEWDNTKGRAPHNPVSVVCRQGADVTVWLRWPHELWCLERFNSTELICLFTQWDQEAKSEMALLCVCVCGNLVGGLRWESNLKVGFDAWWTISNMFVHHLSCLTRHFSKFLWLFQVWWNTLYKYTSIVSSALQLSPQSFRDNMMSSSRSELSELSVCGTDR